MKYDIKLAERFVSDFKLPFAITNRQDIFEYELNLYEKMFFSMTEWNNLWNIIDSLYNGNADEFLTDYYNVRDNIIMTILNSEEYKRFISSPIEELLHINGKLPTWNKASTYSKSIYNNDAIGKTFTSIDIKSANFQVLKYCNVLNDDTYEDFIGRFSNLDYVKKSKYTRQVIFGKLNAGRQISIEKQLMYQIYMNTVPDTDIAYIGNDEIILHGELSDEEKNMIISYAKEVLGIIVKTETFELFGYNIFVDSNNNHRKINEFYHRSCDKDGVYKGLPDQYHNYIFNLIINGNVNDYDLYMSYNNQIIVKMMDKLTVDKIK